LHRAQIAQTPLPIRLSTGDLLMAVTIEKTAIGRLDEQGRLFDAVLKGPTTKPGRFGFRGDIALKFQQQLKDEARPPDYCIEQVLTYAQEGEPTIPILAGYLHNFAYLTDVDEVLRPLLDPKGTYLIFCNNIDLLAKYKIEYNGITYFILPCDESTVWKETMDLMSIDKNDIKKLDTAGKTDYVLDHTLGLNNPEFETITFEEGLKRMEPVKNRNENRPV
jgi:hypothetical protein